jgi:hypothetical protein
VTTGGMGGAGGVLQVECVVDGAPIQLADAGDYSLRDPVLVSGGDGSTATLVAGWQHVEGGPPVYELRHTTFAAWDTWPADKAIGPSFLADYDGGELFTAAPSPGGLGFFFRKPSGSPSAPFGLYYMSPVVPGSGAIPTLVEQAQGGSAPHFVVQGEQPTQHLFGFEGKPSFVPSLDLILFDEATSAKTLLTNVGCASGPISAGAAPSAGGYIVAFTGSSTFEDPACGPASHPVDLAVLRVSKDGVTTPGTTIKGAESDPIYSVRVVPRSDGAWIAWIKQGASGDRLEVARVDAQGTLVLGPVDRPFDGDIFSLAADSVGDRLALAWSSPVRRIEVRVLDDAAGVVASAPVDLAMVPFGRMALLASPSKKALLLAWIAHGDPLALNPVQVARLSCALP